MTSAASPTSCQSCYSPALRPSLAPVDRWSFAPTVVAASQLYAGSISHLLQRGARQMPEPPITRANPDPGTEAGDGRAARSGSGS